MPGSTGPCAHASYSRKRLNLPRLKLPAGSSGPLAVPCADGAGLGQDRREEGCNKFTSCLLTHIRLNRSPFQASMRDQLQACSAAADGNRSHQLRNEAGRVETTCPLRSVWTLLEEVAAFTPGSTPILLPITTFDCFACARTCTCAL